MSRRKRRGPDVLTLVLAAFVVMLGMLLYATAGGWAVALAVVVTLALAGLATARGGRKRGRRRTRARR